MSNFTSKQSLNTHSFSQYCQHDGRSRAIENALRSKIIKVYNYFLAYTSADKYIFHPKSKDQDVFERGGGE